MEVLLFMPVDPKACWNLGLPFNTSHVVLSYVGSVTVFAMTRKCWDSLSVKAKAQLKPFDRICD